MYVIFHNEISNTKVKYQVASATKRIFAGLFDLVFISLISVGFNYLINFLFQKYWMNYSIALYILLVGVISFLFYGGYFILVPWLTKGKTLFRLAFKLQLVERTTLNKYLKHLFIHNSLIYLFFVSILIIMGLSLFAFNDSEQREIVSLFTKNDILKEPTKYIIFISFYRGIYSIYAIILFVIFIFVAVNSKRLALHDRMANLVMIDLTTKTDVNQQTEDKTISNKIDINLPGNMDLTDL
ncbi:RDD family protein [Mycoplasma tullyi]|uniref:RDD family protein n=1 Tax=Mycoplasma tullyi TaxID=1612150 RepID=A0A7D7Y7M4_9MOLU|nr:RDD family protein [Mycoplasma tullyi]QMT98836.1 RDD family protein [Mycoplasma tullyi]